MKEYEAPFVIGHIHKGKTPLSNSVNAFPNTFRVFKPIQTAQEYIKKSICITNKTIKNYNLECQ